MDHPTPLIEDPTAARKAWEEPCILLERPLEAEAQDPWGNTLRRRKGEATPVPFFGPLSISGGVC